MQKISYRTFGGFRAITPVTNTNTYSQTSTNTQTNTMSHTNTPIVTKTPTPTSTQTFTTTATSTVMFPQEFPPLLALKGNQFSKDLTQRHIPLTGPLWYQVLENTCPWLTVDTADHRFVLDGTAATAGTCQVIFKVTNDGGEEVRGNLPVITPVNTRRGNSFSDIKRALKSYDKARKAKNQLT